MVTWDLFAESTSKLVSDLKLYIIYMKSHNSSWAKWQKQNSIKEQNTVSFLIIWTAVEQNKWRMKLNSLLQDGDKSYFLNFAGEQKNIFHL